ncbi:MAG: sporulation protein YqfD [Bacillota bacterium]
MRQLWQKRKGILEIEITGVAVERFLNLALQDDIILQSIQWLSADKILCQVSLKDIYALHPVARKSRCRIHIRRRLGWPFFLQQVNSRKMLFIGGILFCLLFYIAGHIALDIQVTGPVPISAQEALQIKSLAQEQGIEKGKFIFNMDFDAATKHIMRENPHFTFVGISSKGNRIIINAVKRAEVPEDDKKLPPGNIIAGQDAVIQDILVTKGEAMVKAGDTVSAGQILILGYDDNGPQAASGIIRAKTWYQGYGECTISEKGYKNSGNKYTEIQLIWRDEEQLILMGKQFPDYEFFSQTVQVIPLIIWRNIKLPVEVVKKDFREQIAYEVVRTPEQAKEKAVSMAENIARREVPLDAKIIDKKIISIDNDPAMKKARVIMEVLEDIGLFEKYDTQVKELEYKELQQQKKAERTKR